MLDFVSRIYHRGQAGYARLCEYHRGQAGYARLCEQNGVK